MVIAVFGQIQPLEKRDGGGAMGSGSLHCTVCVGVRGHTQLLHLWLDVGRHVRYRNKLHRFWLTYPDYCGNYLLHCWHKTSQVHLILPHAEALF